MNSYVRMLLTVWLFLMTGLTCVAQVQVENKENEMTKEEMLKIHHQMGVDCFNQSWDILLKENRSRADEDVLINLVHASLHHWRQLDQPVNILRGEWMIAHVYTLLGHKEAALYHAENTLKWADEAKAVDWDLAYAYEAMARAQALNGNKEEFQKYHDLAAQAGTQIKEEGDRQQFDADFNDNNWFGMK